MKETGPSPISYKPIEERFAETFDLQEKVYQLGSSPNKVDHSKGIAGPEAVVPLDEYASGTVLRIMLVNKMREVNPEIPEYEYRHCVIGGVYKHDDRLCYATYLIGFSDDEVDGDANQIQFKSGYPINLDFHPLYEPSVPLEDVYPLMIARHPQSVLSSFYVTQRVDVVIPDEKNTRIEPPKFGGRGGKKKLIPQWERV